MNRGMKVLILIMLIVFGTSGFAQVSTGVSDDRVSLPEGPGSVMGIGENVNINPSMGMMNYGYSIGVPGGFPGLTPALSLSYSSGAGLGAAGIGWSFSMPSIERMTLRGLPKYTTDDEFVANGAELVKLPNTDPPVYRARFEGGFVRYTWMDAGDGKTGYWVAEYPDGSKAWFGADSNGTPDANARAQSDAGTFTYYLTEKQDPYGHKIVYTYEKPGNYPLLSKVEWVFKGQDGAAVYRVEIKYEDRNDKISDCKPGFEMLLDKRVKEFKVISHGEQLARYVMQYETGLAADGFSRLKTVIRYGRNDHEFPIHQTWHYTQSLGTQCDGTDCRKPYVTSLGSLGINMKSGDTTLLDINGDGLPDIIDTSQEGQYHRIWINTLRADGTQEFVGPTYSKVGRQDSFDLSSPYCQIMDVDGDGFSDMVNTQTGKVLHNLGTGDWAEIYDLWSSGNGGVPDLNGDFDPSDGQLKTVRFMDYNGDKRVDLIRSMNAGASNTTQIYRNLGNGGFQSVSNVQSIGAGFDSDTLELEDMNGDGLLDPVQVLKSEVRYRLNLGWGRWSDWIVISGFNFSDTQAKDAELEDINGDGLADLVLVSGNQVDYWLNRNGAHFDAKKTITSADINGDIPTRTPETTVLCADMNSNGSSDIVWIDGSGKVTYLEIFPVRPNLLTKIENGLGKVAQLDYGTAAQHLADDGGPGSWKYAIPVQINVVDKVDEWDLQNQVHSIVDYTYHDGYYDGKAKQLRGFERVEQTVPADDDSEGSMTKSDYDVGHDDIYHKNLLIKQVVLSGDKVIQVNKNQYGDCPVAGIPESGLKFPIRFICLKQSTVEDREGLTDQSKWVKTEKKYEYDGYGNTTLLSDLGIVSIGGQGCGACDPKLGFGHPCGADCQGDEIFSRSEYITPENNDDRWMLHLPIKEQLFTSADANGNPADDVYAETDYFYDGDAFTGLEAGKATHGGLTRKAQRMTADHTVDVNRYKLNADGMVVESLDALGEPGSDGHRRAYEYDADGLRVTKTTVFLKNADGPYQLQRTYTYDPVLGKPIAGSLWYIVRNGANVTTPQKMFYTWDDFGRLTSRSYVGALPGKPTEQYSYHYGSPVSTVTMDARSRADGEFDVHQVKCFDGFGRMFQTRSRISGDQYLVSKFQVFNTKGDPKKVYQNYMATGEDCDTRPPEGVQAVTSYYDGLGRLTRQEWPKPDKDDPGVWETRVKYEPNAVYTYDMEDTLAGGEFENTPKVVYTNGLGNTIKIQQITKAGEDPVIYTYTYDKLDRLSGWIGPEGNRFKQERDLWGNVVMTDDPDRGKTTYEFDDAGNPVKITDARGKTRQQTFDGDNRVIAQWDPDDEAGTKVLYSYDFPGDCDPAKCTNTPGFLVKTDYPLSDGTHGFDVTGYDVMGRPIYFARMLNGHKFEFLSDYDNLGRTHSDTFPDGTKFEYKFDDSARLLKVPNYIDSVTYDDRGQLTGMAFANGTELTQAFDDRLMLASIRVTGPTGKAIVDQAYERDREGHITAVLDNVIADGVPSDSGNFKMDSLYRLIGATLDPGRAGLEEKLAYSYSPSGRLLSKKSSLGGDSLVNLGDYKYGENGAGPHAVTTVGGQSLTYDKAGHLLTKGDDSYQWDFRGRMVAAMKNGKPVASFDYGDGKKRIIKRENGVTTYYLTNRFEVRNGTAVSYLDVGGDHVVRVKNRGFAAKILSDLAPVTGTDDAITPQPDQEITAGDAWVAQAIGAGLMTLKKKQDVSNVRALLLASANRMLDGDQPVTTWLHRDYRGDIVAQTDADAKVVATAVYYPYGALRYSTGQVDPYGYADRETDESTGLMYFGQRYAEPVTGQWTSPDPMFSVAGDAVFDSPAQAVNPYAFSQNNPVSYVDSDGRFANFIIGGVVGAVTSMISEAMVQKASGNKLLSFKSIGMILLKGALGFGVGALTSGIAAITTMGISNILGGISEAFARFKKVKAGWAMAIGIGVSTITNVVGTAVNAIFHLDKGVHAIKGFGKFLKKAGTSLLVGVGKLFNALPSLTKKGRAQNRDATLIGNDVKGSARLAKNIAKKVYGDHKFSKLTRSLKRKMGAEKVTERTGGLRRTEKGGRIGGLRKTKAMRNMGFRRHNAMHNLNKAHE